MKSFKKYVNIREALVADDGNGRTSIDDQEIFEILANIMRDAWTENPELVMKCLHVLEQEKPGKFRSRIEEVASRKKSPYGKGLDKPNDFHHDIIKPEADRTGDPAGND
jgi:hypothetical protein